MAPTLSIWLLNQFHRQSQGAILMSMQRIRDTTGTSSQPVLGTSIVTG
jgi:hypothetical protein